MAILRFNRHLTDSSTSHTEFSGILNSKSALFNIVNHIWNETIGQGGQDRHQNIHWRYFHIIIIYNDKFNKFIIITIDYSL